uniref:ATP synthase F0 subunit 8 n=1 Tax=Astroscopus sexspinosus TaxID=3127373 RepID=UPI0030FE9CC6
MPQLNPTPWFATLLFSWFVLLTIIPPKVLTHVFPNKLTPGDKKTTQVHNWNWTWQ